MNTKFRKAFSMIELILVMVVLGIVASMGATIISQVYENYILQRATHETTTKTELAASIIYNRLANRISTATVGIHTNGTVTYINDIEPDADNVNRYKVLEWYGIAMDSFISNGSDGKPGWSGVCDVDSNQTTSGSISTPGSNLVQLNTVVSNLSEKTGMLGRMAVIFADKKFRDTSPVAISYNTNCMGFTGNSSCIARVSGVTGDTINLDTNYTSLVVAEHYHLIRSAYALVQTNPRDRDEDGIYDLFDLELRYDYQPWEGDNYNDSTTARKTLLKNVSVFRFSGVGDTLRFKICADEQVGGNSIDDRNGEYVSICKEKAVIR